jgi:spore coat polysaccharide biosynthesis predicted glycosyltransferase SpsG
MRALYRADGGTAIGTGHVLRGLRIAEALRALRPAEFTFVSRPDPWAVERIRREGSAVEELVGDELDALFAAARRIRPDLLALDRLETTPALIRPLRELGCPLLTFDDVGEGRFSCDALINILEEEPSPQRLAAADVALYQGPAYAVLPPGYDAAPRPRAVSAQVGSILVTMGGGDPLGLSVKVTRALASLIGSGKAEFVGEQRRCSRRAGRSLGEGSGEAALRPYSLRVTVVAGAASPWLDDLQELARTASGRIVVKRAVPRLLDEFLQADLALVAGGLTIHEAMATGTPAIAVCQEVRHQAEMAARFEAQGTMVSLGRGQELHEDGIAQAVASLAADLPRRRALSERGQELVDGKGTQRVAKIFADLGRQR